MLTGAGELQRPQSSRVFAALISKSTATALLARRLCNCIWIYTIAQSTAASTALSTGKFFQVTLLNFAWSAAVLDSGRDEVE